MHLQLEVVCTGNSFGGPKNHKMYKLLFPFQGPRALPYYSFFFFFLSQSAVWNLILFQEVGTGVEQEGEEERILMPTEETHQ